MLIAHSCTFLFPLELSGGATFRRTKCINESEIDIHREVRPRYNVFTSEQLLSLILYCITHHISELRK